MDGTMKKNKWDAGTTFRLGGIFCLFLALAACASDEEKPEAEPEAPPKAEIKTKNLICPQVAVVKEADEAVDYANGEADPAKLIAKARLTGIEGDCGYRTGDADESGIDISFTLKSMAMRGPKLPESNKVSFPFFVAVLDPSDNIVTRQTLSAGYRFPGDDKLREQSEQLHVFIPMPEEKLIAGPDYRVLVGFTKAKAE